MIFYKIELGENSKKNLKIKIGKKEKNKERD